MAVAVFKYICNRSALESVSDIPNRIVSPQLGLLDPSPCSSRTRKLVIAPKKAFTLAFQSVHFFQVSSWFSCSHLIDTIESGNTGFSFALERGGGGMCYVY